MSDEAQRVLDALMEYDSKSVLRCPMTSIQKFIESLEKNISIDDDYQSLSVEEEKQVIESFFKFAY